MHGTNKISWSGLLLGVQPRIDLSRSFDQRHHGYLGYLLLVDGEAGGERKTFSVRIGPAAQAKYGFRAGDRVSGAANAVENADREVADFYKASELRIEERPAHAPPSSPPWVGVPPTLEAYRARGHRRLDARTYDHACRTCQWGCRMAVAMIVDALKMSLSPDSARIDALNVRYDDSDLAMQGQFSNLVGYALGGDVLSGRLSITSKNLDVRKFQGAEPAPSGKAGKGKKAKAAPPAPTPEPKKRGRPRNTPAPEPAEPESMEVDPVMEAKLMEGIEARLRKILSV